jgi:hypothetical protein
VEQVEEVRFRDGVLSMPRGNGRVDAEAASTLQLATARGEETPAESLHNFAFLRGEATAEIGGNSLGQEVITAYSGSFGDAKIRVVAMPVQRGCLAACAGHGTDAPQGIGAVQMAQVTNLCCQEAQVGNLCYQKAQVTDQCGREAACS